MAMSLYYVDPASGNDTTGDGTIGTPWKSVQKALDTITRNSTDGDQINVKAGAADTLTAALSLITYGTPGETAPLIFRGYTSAANDGGRGEIDGDGQYSIFISSANSNKNYVSFWDMKIGNCGSAQVLDARNGTTLVNCEIYGSSATNAVNMSGTHSRIVHCSFHSLSGSNNVNCTFDILIAYCSFHSSSASNILNITSSGFAYCINCIFVVDTDTSVTAISGGAAVINCSLYSASANTEQGINGTAAYRPALALNNVIQGWSGAGGAGLNVSGIGNIYIHGGNAFRNNTTDQSIAAVKGVYQLNAPLALAADPFVDAASGDFRLKTDSDAIEAAFPASWPGYAATTNAADIGAVQRGAGSGSGIIRRVARILGG